jgi:hypothetical protein
LEIPDVYELMSEFDGKCCTIVIAAIAASAGCASFLSHVLREDAGNGGDEQLKPRNRFRDLKLNRAAR